MSQLTDNLYSIDAIKSGIRSAIEEKGVDMTGLSFQDYPAAISQISTGGTFVTETLSVSSNGMYTPGQGIDGYSQVVVDVPQSVTGFTEKDVTEGHINIVNLNNSASFVSDNVFANNNYLVTVDLSQCKTVGYNAFNSCKNLESVNMSVVNKIGSRAFMQCSSLTTVSLPTCTSLYEQAFLSCKLLSDVYIPNVRFISSIVFGSCSALSTINLPNCYSINQKAFEGCTSLNEVNAPNCYYIENSIFTSCTGLTTVSFPRLTYCGGLVFVKCKSVSEFVFPYLTSVAGATFNECNNGNLNVVSVPNLLAISKWYNNAMLLNTSLSDLYIGTNVYGVLDYTSVINGSNTIITGSIYVNGYEYSKYIVANGWSSISSILVPVGDVSTPMLQYSDGVVFGNTGAIESSFLSYLGISKSSVAEVNLPSCKCILSSTFERYSLSYANLPECEYIGNFAFRSCYSLTDVSLSQCKYVGDSAFQYCSNLTKIDLPTCECIGQYGFASCSNLSSIYLPVCSYIGFSAFYTYNGVSCSITLGYSGVVNTNGSPGALNASFYVPASLVDAYKSAQYWSFYSSRIFPIPEP